MVQAHRLLPAHRSMYSVDGEAPKIILVLDNAPYRHKVQPNAVNVNSLNKLKPSAKQVAAGDTRTLKTIVEQ